MRERIQALCLAGPLAASPLTAAAHAAESSEHIEGIGHLVHLEEPQRFNKVVLSFDKDRP